MDAKYWDSCRAQSSVEKLNTLIMYMVKQYVNVYSRMISHSAKLLSVCDNKIVNVLYKFCIYNIWMTLLKTPNVFIEFEMCVAFQIYMATTRECKFKKMGEKMM